MKEENNLKKHSEGNKISKKLIWIMAGMFILFGSWAVLVGLGVLSLSPPDEISVGKTPPLWPLILIGGFFLASGLALINSYLLKKTYQKLQILLNFLVCGTYSFVFGYIALTGHGTFEGGFQFLSTELNKTIARFLFGFFAIVALIISINSLRKRLD